MTTAVASPVTQYAEAAAKGKIVVGRLVRLAAERHLRDLDTQAERGLYWDEAAANRAVEFFPRWLTLSEAAPFELQPWEAFIVGSLFGWKLADRTRRFRVAYIEIGKGNGKSPLAAGIGIYMLIADGEDRAEVYSAAVDRDQAQILFRDAVSMVNASPELNARLQRSGGAGKEWNLYDPTTGSHFRPISSESSGRGKSGFRVHCGLLDEVHEHPTAAMVDFMRANAKSPPGDLHPPLLVEITNSGADRRTVCYQHHDLSVRVLDGTVENDAWFAYVCGLDLCEKCRAEGKASPEGDCPDCDDWRDPEVWKKANPNLDVSISSRYLRELVAEAVAMPSKENIVKRLNFCIWTQTVNRWITDELWANDNAMPDLKGKSCTAGLVASSAIDLAALVLWFPEDNAVLPFFWMPRELMRGHSERDSVSYETWVGDGLMEATEGDATDYDAIRAKVTELGNLYDIRKIALFRYDHQLLATQLDGDGFEVVQFSNSYKDISPGAKALEAGLLEKSIAHGNNPVLRWSVSNAAVHRNSDDHINFDRERSAGNIYGALAWTAAITIGLDEDDSTVGVTFV